MEKLTINKILEITKGKLLTKAEDEKIENWNKDTRTIEKGDFYVAIKGETFNGNKYIEEALQKGAIGAIVDENISNTILEKYENLPIIQVENTIKAIQEVASYKRSLYNIPVVAVTGSVGKTSTKDMIASVLSQKYDVLKTQGNLNNHIGLPFTLLKLKEHTAIVVEMGMNNFGEISVLTNIAKPTIAVITNIGTSHIGKLGSRENILKAKLEILEGLNENGLVVINQDNDLLSQWKITTNQRINTFGINTKSDYYAYDIKQTTKGSCFKIKLEEKEYEIKVPIGGDAFIYNSLAAIVVAKELKMNTEDISKGIGDLQLTKQRMDVEKTKEGITIINDSYNASYDSMKTAIEYMKQIKGKRKIAVLGDMLELGDFSQKLHEKVGEEVAKNQINILVTVGKEAKFIEKRAKELGIKESYCFENKEEAIEKINSIKTKDDIILFKASNGMKFNEMVEKIKGE